MVLCPTARPWRGPADGQLSHPVIEEPGEPARRRGRTLNLSERGVRAGSEPYLQVPADHAYEWYHADMETIGMDPDGSEWCALQVGATQCTVASSAPKAGGITVTRLI
jgi:hypothetical protein